MKRQYTDQELMNNVKISEHQLNGGKIAIFKTTYWEPVAMLDFAIEKYVGNDVYNEFIDIKCDDPWTRVVISDINSLQGWWDFQSKERAEKLLEILGED
jgi:hypothetical protein